jgi:ABC-2 type transport system ATP-binding protein
MLRIEHLTKNYGSFPALTDLNLEIPDGELHGFVGPNGAGKTTTMKSMVCYITPDSGDITIGPYSIREHPGQVRRNIGYLPELNPLYEDMPVVDFLHFMAALQQVPKREIPGRTAEMIRLCGLTAEKHKKIGELSKGYKQRVGLAQALIHDPAVLILDEPTSGLDPNQMVEIRELIRTVGKSKTVLLSSHILSEVEATCDRIVVINKGRIVADGTAAELRSTASGRERLRVRIEAPEGADVPALLQALPSVEKAEWDADARACLVTAIPDASARNEIFALCVAQKWQLTEITGIETSLEDVFRMLTTPS